MTDKISVSEKSESDITSSQLNIAAELRAAGRDYREYWAPGSIELILATSSKAKRDEFAINSEYMFAYRFGFKATPTVRPQVIDFKNKYELLDEEICKLKRAGFLNISRQELTIYTSSVPSVCGWILVIFISLIYLSAILDISGLDPLINWKREIIQILFGTLWFGSMGIVFKLLISPWQTLKKAGVVRAT